VRPLAVLNCMMYTPVFDTTLKDQMVLVLNNNIFGFHFEESLYFLLSVSIHDTSGQPTSEFDTSQHTHLFQNFNASFQLSLFLRLQNLETYAHVVDML
jgi:hypothetical protein